MFAPNRARRYCFREKTKPKTAIHPELKKIGRPMTRTPQGRICVAGESFSGMQEGQGNGEQSDVSGRVHNAIALIHEINRPNILSATRMV